MSNNKHSLSGYTKIYTLNQLAKSFSKGDYDSACFWSVEMHISCLLYTSPSPRDRG